VRIFLGILTDHRPGAEAYRKNARNTYLFGCPLDYKFFYGKALNGTKPRPDEIFLDCDDRKEYMALKDQGMFRYALKRGYDFCFRACHDTLVMPDRLIKLAERDLYKHDYAGQVPSKINFGGYFKIWMKYFDYMHGGCGIWLSKKAMERLVQDIWKGPKGIHPEKLIVWGNTEVPGHQIYWDDLWIGEVLKGNLSIDDPKRNNPFQAYADAGIKVFEDDLVFCNADEDRIVAVHDPGKPKPHLHLELK
jgi:hypothetical protein